MDELEAVAFTLGLTALEVRTLPAARESVLERVDLGDGVRVRAEQWRSVAARLLSRNEAAAKQHSHSGTVSFCRACDSPIWWGETEGGKRMSLDPLARPMGNVIRLAQGKRMVLRVVPPSALPVVGRPAYQSHFASCPHADELRRRREAKSAAAAAGQTCTPGGHRTRPCPVCGTAMRLDLVDIGFEFHPGCYPEETL